MVVRSLGSRLCPPKFRVESGRLREEEKRRQGPWPKGDRKT